LLLAGYLVLINNIFNVLTMTEILILSSVLCATDTVAANSLIKAEKFPVLNAVLFGEGILNDAVAIILYGTVSKLKIDEIGGELTYIYIKAGSKWSSKCF
jgi:NhaP-type Na+/H+ or K+/H+ antiporter